MVRSSPFLTYTIVLTTSLVHVHHRHRLWYEFQLPDDRLVLASDTRSDTVHLSPLSLGNSDVKFLRLPHMEVSLHLHITHGTAGLPDPETRDAVYNVGMDPSSCSTAEIGEFVG